jgi:hypothetical protein
MSQRTAPLHSPSELTLIGCDDRTNIAVFQAPSAHDPSRVNTVALDLITGAILCDCKGAECGRACWHADLVGAAWAASPAMGDVRWLTADQLARYGRKLAAMAANYRARCGRVLPADALNLVAARCEWRRRAALAPAPIVGITPALPLAA